MLVVVLGFIAIIATGDGNGDGNGVGDNEGENSDDTTCDFNIDVVCENTISPTTGEPCVKICHKNSGDPNNFIIFNDKLIFTAYEGCKNISQQKLFELDEIGNIAEIIESSLRINSEKIILNNVLYFISNGYLYKYDGLNQAKKIFPDYTESIFAIENLMAYNNKIYFNYSGFNDELNSSGLYSYAGAGTPKFLGDVCADGTYILYDGRLYFRGRTADFGSELWCYDEDGSGLYMVADINPSGDSVISNIVEFQEKLFFDANDGVNGDQLWMIDNENPPVMVTNLPEIAYEWGMGDSWIRPVAVFQEKLLCEVTEQVGLEYYERLYEYDGTDPLKPLPVNYSYESHMWLYYSQDINTYIIFNNHFYFLAVDTSIGFWNAQFLWDYDGVEAPVKIETDDYISNIHLHNGKLLLQEKNNKKVFSYDSNSLQVLFESVDLGMYTIYLEKIFYDNYFVTGQNEKNGRELWKIDISGEIELVEDFYPGTSCYCDCAD